MDENVIYIQHSYNREVHTSLGNPSFETCFGYLPPSPLDVIYRQQWGVREYITSEALGDEKVIDKVRKIHLQVHHTLKKS